MSKVFTPFSIIIGLAAGQLARVIFSKVWGEIRGEEPPAPDIKSYSFAQLIPALIVEGAIQRLVRGTVDHGLRIAWERSTGTWPGDEEPAPE